MGLLVLAGCSLPLPEAKNDPTRVYVLSAPNSGAATGAAAVSTGGPVVRLRPVEIASYLRARPIIVRRGENELEFREFARWAEPLEHGIARILREELLARGAASAVQGAGSRSGELTEPRFEVSVRVLACEGNADGTVNFEATWDVSNTDASGSTVARGHFHPTDLRWTPKNEATLAAGLSRAVAGLADEIGSALAKAK